MEHESDLRTPANMRHPCPHAPPTHSDTGASQEKLSSRLDGDAAPACWALLCARDARLVEPSLSAYPFYR